jgi:hypothetical protein
LKHFPTPAVLRRIHQGDHPDALLCDIFFYESVAEAERVEEKIEELATLLKRTASETGLKVDHLRRLMKPTFQEGDEFGVGHQEARRHRDATLNACDQARAKRINAIPRTRLR